MELVVVIIFIALVFDFLNGFHDAANSIATIVSTRVLTPRKAVMWAAFFNLIAAFMFDVHIAKTFGTGLIDILKIDQYVIMSGLLGAIAWNIITWYFGLPTSSSHALMGGYAGAAIAKAGFSVILVAGWTKTLIFIAIAPLMGMLVGFVMMAALQWMYHKKSSAKINQRFRTLQLFSAALYSIGHGTNDAQKTMGIITSVLMTAAIIPNDPNNYEVPYWVILICHFAIALGTMFGGWRIVKTMGQKITKLKPSGGFCAETAGGFTLLITAFWGISVSTTHTITGAIMGVGATKRLSAVKWGVAGNIVMAWILTIPLSALVGAVSYGIVSLFI